MKPFHKKKSTGISNKHWTSGVQAGPYPTSSRPPRSWKMTDQSDGSEQEVGEQRRGRPRRRVRRACRQTVKKPGNYACTKMKQDNGLVQCAQKPLLNPTRPHFPTKSTETFMYALSRAPKMYRTSPTFCLPTHSNHALQ